MHVLIDAPTVILTTLRFHLLASSQLKWAPKEAPEHRFFGWHEVSAGRRPAVVGVHFFVFSGENVLPRCFLVPCLNRELMECR